ncbi:MAG TPA: helix-turn-helix domain-containing protein [Verrucomicrobiae bacterium]|jgi:putative transcriptional regulator|nr:helix-turn-helix domain-containing protein [Verrucomicrobiae bacterium]
MNKERFQELTKALRQAKAAQRGEVAPSRVWNVTRDHNGKLVRLQLDPKTYQRQRQMEWDKTIAATRTRLKLSQNKFAELLGISVKTLHNWEQGRRQPTGAARVLLRVALRHPEVVLEEAMGIGRSRGN